MICLYYTAYQAKNQLKAIVIYFTNRCTQLNRYSVNDYMVFRLAALPGEKNRLERCEHDFEPKSGLENRFCLNEEGHFVKAVPRLSLFF